MPRRKISSDRCPWTAEIITSLISTVYGTATIGLGADRVDDGVIALEQILVRDGGADLDVAEEPKAGFCSGFLEGARDGLDVLVVGGDAKPDEPPRRRQAVDHVHLDGRFVALQQRVGGIEAGGAGADDRDPERRGAHSASLARSARRASVLSRG